MEDVASYRTKSVGGVYMATQYGSLRRYRTNTLKGPTNDDQTLTTSYSVTTQESG